MRIKSRRVVEPVSVMARRRVAGGVQLGRRVLPSTPEASLGWPASFGFAPQAA